jgi:hypothetical protein
MIVRFASFAPMTEEEDAETRRNLFERFMAALKAQDGLVFGTRAIAEDGTWRSITGWESEEAMRAGAERANASPLLPGQDASMIPSPARTEIFEVVAHF